MLRRAWEVEMSAIPDDLSYTKDHEWVTKPDSDLIKFGITDYATIALGDIVYIQLPQVGQSITAGSVCGEVESTKSVSEIYAPVSGKITRINDELNSRPEIINQSPYGAGWIAEVSVETQGPLLSADQYRALIGE